MTARACELLAELDVEPGAALMVGDTLFDLEMARHAGVPAVAVSWGVHARERIAAAGPRAVIDAWPELTSWLVRQRVADARGPRTAP
ncbi:MAG: HAD hydrolase-like protein [Halofilum sp. (in: g-proteobacteria)]|nr:HAD hydrolase-like protein [Halofilum sp. (in: g-proteobacteria)]